MKLSFGEKITYAIFILVLIMVNPPVINTVNQYCMKTPLTFGWPTMLVWLDFWYLVGVITSVSYTHLDVYKRQAHGRARGRANDEIQKFDVFNSYQFCCRLYDNSCRA